ncbi:MAG: hypothetical protein LBH81_03600 [Rickettsiales bacterium]|jgi:hypothetical protein|nr:hypothetical protein [Rickettsiales bacterium]
MAICSDYLKCAHFAALYKKHLRINPYDNREEVPADAEGYEKLIKNKLVLTRCLSCKDREK